ncbi:hypothetical protein UFOVP849_9 [uncultured Caudovirales phage]|uniref:Uncharacterized protein n=1 Tax=uncultured Caudovirales phage TaxID=2100421 RepID=A0A6J5PEE7_9CAUD|nr:hypothetical protein UFOVP849_9 [uncultured Caudovirales phage]
MAKRDQYILVEITQRPSKLHAGDYWSITLYGLEDGQIWEMSVAPNYDNYKTAGWDHIVHHPTPYGVYTGFSPAKKNRKQRYTSDGFPVLNADGMANLIYRCSDRDEALALVAADQDQRTPLPNNMKDLFE